MSLSGSLPARKQFSRSDEIVDVTADILPFRLTVSLKALDLLAEKLVAADLCQSLETTLANLFVKQSFSPSAYAQDSGAQTGAQSGTVGDSLSGMPGSDSQPSGLSGSPVGGSFGDAGQAEGQMEQ